MDLNYIIHPSAAIYGLRNKTDISIFILHPKGRVSPIQEAQMTTVLDENVHNIAVKGTFDDCQVTSLPLITLNLLLNIYALGYCQISIRRQGLQR